MFPSQILIATKKWHHVLIFPLHSHLQSHADDFASMYRCIDGQFFTAESFLLKRDDPVPVIRSKANKYINKIEQFCPVPPRHLFKTEVNARLLGELSAGLPRNQLCWGPAPEAHLRLRIGHIQELLSAREQGPIPSLQFGPLWRAISASEHPQGSAESALWLSFSRSSPFAPSCFFVCPLSALLHAPIPISVTFPGIQPRTKNLK